MNNKNQNLTAVVFPGQGAQTVQMGLDIYNSECSIGQAYRFALKNAAPQELIEKMHVADLEEISKTQNTQPLMVAFEISLFEVLRGLGFKPDYTAGLSLGEYSALAASGYYSSHAAVELAAYRGEIMSAAGGGSMAAVLGMDEEKLQAAIDSVSSGFVHICNYNCPGQLVISGDTDAVAEALEAAAQMGARRIIPLNVSAGFHSPLMEGVAGLLRERLDETKHFDIGIPMVFNSTGLPLGEGEDITDILVSQMTSPIYFEKSVRYMIDQGVQHFIELGPGRVLSGFIRKIDRNIKTTAVSNLESLRNLVSEIKEQ